MDSAAILIIRRTAAAPKMRYRSVTNINEAILRGIFNFSMQNLTRGSINSDIRSAIEKGKRKTAILNTPKKIPIIAAMIRRNFESSMIFFL